MDQQQQKLTRSAAILGQNLHIQFMNCSICQDLYFDPVMELTKQHVFCSECIQKINNICPTCQCEVKYQPARLEREILSLLKTKCQWSMTGCPWEGSYCDLKIHLNNNKCSLKWELTNINQQILKVLENEFQLHIVEAHQLNFEYLSNSNKTWNWWIGDTECVLCKKKEETLMEQVQPLEEARQKLLKNLQM